jgi:hypothetical protein
VVTRPNFGLYHSITWVLEALDQIREIKGIITQRTARNSMLFFLQGEICNSSFKEGYERK